MTTKLFIERAMKKFGDYYDYSLVDYKDMVTKVIIICPIHGKFEQTPQHHLRTHGCFKCGHKIAANKRLSNIYSFEKKALKIHCDFYDYSKSIYEHSEKPIIIICPIHGEFEQLPSVHLKGSKCPQCAEENRIKLTSLSLKEFINGAKEIHGDFYDYSLTEYINSKIKVKIICPIHGEFLQLPQNHLHGRGCPKCANIKKSKEEENIYKILNDWNINIIKNDRLIFQNKYELDLYLPNYNLAIEYNGLYWHSSEFRDNLYHQNKYLDCYEKGINLIQIFEDEWLHQREKVIDKLKRYLNIQKDNIIDINQCVIEELNNQNTLDLYYFEEDNFLEIDDLRHEKSDINIVLKYNNEIISILSLNKENDNKYIITRFFDRLNYQINNSFKTLLNWFIQNFKSSEIEYSDDLRWSQEKLLLNNGFVFDKLIEPKEYYTIKSNQNRLKYGNSDDILSIYKIFDAGTKLYKMLI